MAKRKKTIERGLFPDTPLQRWLGAYPQRACSGARRRIGSKTFPQALATASNFDLAWLAAHLDQITRDNLNVPTYVGAGSFGVPNFTGRWAAKRYRDWMRTVGSVVPIDLF